MHLNIYKFKLDKINNKTINQLINTTHKKKKDLNREQNTNKQEKKNKKINIYIKAVFK